MDYLTLTTSGALAVFIQVIAWFWLKERLARSIQHEYDANIERLKHDLELELDKKKRLYEGKLNQYKKYFQFIDRSSEAARSELFTSLGEKMLELIKNPSEESSIEYFRSILLSQDDINNRFLTFKTEINDLRLEAGKDLLELLDQYTNSLEEVQSITVAFMSSLNQNIERFITENNAIQREIDDFMHKIESGPGAKTKKLKDDIFWEMRKELGII